MGLFRFDPNQIGTILQAGNAIQNAAVFASARTELEQVGRQALGTQQLSVAVEDNVAIARRCRIDFLAIEEAVILVAKIACFLRNRDLLSQASAERVGARHDDAIGNAELEEGITASTDFLQEVFVGHGDFTILVATLLFVRNLIFDLQGARTCFDHLLGEQIGGFCISETGVDICDDRNHMCFEILDLRKQFSFFRAFAIFPGLVEVTEQQVQFAAVGLA